MKLYQISADFGIEYLETVVAADARGVRRGQVPAPVREYAETWARSIARGHDKAGVTVSEYSPPVVGRENAGAWGVSHALESWQVTCPPF